MIKLPNQQHIGHIESLRALAALMVMGFHFISFHNGKDFIIYNEKIRTLSEFGAQGVELFYIISGFVIAYSFERNQYQIKNYLTYLAKRIIRIIPTYFIAMILALAIGTILDVYLWELPFKFDWKQFFANLTFTCDLFEIPWYNELYKTLKVEFQFYLAIGLLWPLMKHKISRSIITILWLIGAYFTAQHQTLLINGPYFLIGVSLCFIYLKRDLIYNWTTTAFCLAFIGTFYEMQDFIIVVIGVALINLPVLTTKLSEKIGKSSYSLYLFHGTIGGWFLYFFTKDHLIHLNHKIAILIASVLSVLIALLFYRFLEKPFIKLGKQLKYKTD